MRAHRDAGIPADSFHGVFEDLHEALLHLGLVEIHRVKSLLQLQRPENIGRARSLKKLHGAPKDVVQIARSLGAGILFLPAKGGQVLRNLRGFLRPLFHFHE